LHNDLAVELLYDLFTDKEAQTDSVGVHLLGTVELAKHLKEAELILRLDSNASISNRDDYLVLITC